jgi:N-acetylmuramoyl-L-alanine amidase
VIRWDQPGGLNAYRDDGTGHFGQRDGRAVWTLDELRRHVDLVVIHYDAVGNSRDCFKVLQKRGFSCHFLIDTDGTIYQTLDLRERAWHATIANDRSIGIELAHHGAVETESSQVQHGEIVGVVQGKRLRQPPFTDAQYDALAKLLPALSRAFPRIALDYPRGPDGRVIPHKLTDAQFAAFSGVIGHFHVQTDKVDPGPAFDWPRVMRDARRAAAR